MIHRLPELRRWRDLSPGQRRANGDAATGRFRLVAIQGIGRANGQAEAALHALVGQHSDAMVGLLKRHARVGPMCLPGLRCVCMAVRW
ncbi:hypothetical protein GCM10011408_33990 [Dyella caseinilytica]|nr:hypothetical protein GCM10011408_33990 [Dyella caseinilytica]